MALAQAAVGMDPPAKLYVAGPGTSAEGTINITNPNETPLTVRIYLSDWHYAPEGRQEFLEPGSLSQSSSTWITFSPSELTLQGNENATIRYTAEVPLDATPGTHWSMLFVEGINPNPVPGDRLATMTVRVGHTIYVNVAPTHKDGVIAGIFGTPPTDYSNPYQLAIQYANTGNAAHAVGGRLELRDSNGETVAAEEVEAVVVLPGSVRIVPTSLYGPLSPGFYTVLVILNYGDIGKDVAGEYSFVLEEPLTALRLPDPDVNAP